MVGRVPLLRRLRKEPEETPPEPVHEMKPSLSDAERRSLTADVPIDVRVYVTDSGSVNFAELLASRAASRHRDLADAAVLAARRWSFRPAKAGSENVPSEVVLHFLFSPADGPR
jgi:TonB family protein